MSKPKRIKELEKYISVTVGDGKAPNLFFVSSNGANILISRYFDVAYRVWRGLASDRRIESALEDRQHGVLASVEPESDAPGARNVVHDDTNMLRRLG